MTNKTCKKTITGKEIEWRFTISLEHQGGDCETLATPPIKIPFFGQPIAFVITKLNVYQGEKGNELLTKVITIDDIDDTQKEK